MMCSQSETSVFKVPPESCGQGLSVQYVLDEYLDLSHQDASGRIQLL